jgi:hypothetical protein
MGGSISRGAKPVSRKPKQDPLTPKNIFFNLSKQILLAKWHYLVLPPS